MSIITPPPYGRPDYSAPRSSLFGAPFVNTRDAVIQPGAQVTYGPFDVSQWAYIGGNIQSTVYPLQASVSWNGNTDGYWDFYDGAIWTVLPPTFDSTDFYLPNKTPAISISLQNLGAGAIYNGYLYAYGSNAPGVAGINPMSSSIGGQIDGAYSLPPVNFPSQGGFSTVTYYVSTGTGTVTIYAPSASGGLGTVLWQDAGFTSGNYHTANIVVPLGTWICDMSVTPGPANFSVNISPAVPF